MGPSGTPGPSVRRRAIPERDNCPASPGRGGANSARRAGSCSVGPSFRNWSDAGQLKDHLAVEIGTFSKPVKRPPAIGPILERWRTADRTAGPLVAIETPHNEGIVPEGRPD